MVDRERYGYLDKFLTELIGIFNGPACMCVYKKGLPVFVMFWYFYRAWKRRSFR